MGRAIKRASLFAIMAIVLATVSLFTFTRKSASAAIEFEEVERSADAFHALPHPPLANPLKVSLGRRLFSDKRLSHDNTVSCQSCHDLSFYGSDARPFSIGIGQQLGTANAPTVFNATLNFRQFWDGRAKSIEDQIAGPVHNPIEMGSSWNEIIGKLKSDLSYVSDFRTIYGRDPDQSAITDAITTFENQLITLNSPFDRYLNGDLAALSDVQKNGLKKFRSFGCGACHQGRNVGGNMFQTLGVMGDYFKDRGGSFPSDAGLYNVTHREQDRHVFKVPSLRNVAMTPPYFHTGQVTSLGDAVRLMAHYQLGRELSEQDEVDLVSFLNSLTGERPVVLTSSSGVEK